MNRFVVDNSVVVAWAFDEGSDEADRWLDALEGAEALAPSIWPLELANVLAAAERRGRISGAEVARVLHVFRVLPIRVVPETPLRVFTSILDLARQEGLSAYDASYLDLALREGLPLATLDRDLAAAAQRRGVSVRVPM